MGKRHGHGMLRSSQGTIYDVSLCYLRVNVYAHITCVTCTVLFMLLASVHGGAE